MVRDLGQWQAGLGDMAGAEVQGGGSLCGTGISPREGIHGAL